MQYPRINGGAWNGFVVVAALFAAMVSSARAGSGNYLIIVPEDYDGTAPMLQFAGAKATAGFDVDTYVVPSGTSKEAIKTHIEGLWGTQVAPDYILLVGDTGGSVSATATTIPHWTGGGSKHCVTDLPYACMDAGDDWHPDIAIGRFSVSSLSELQTVVDKTLFVEAGVFSDPKYVTRGAFLANPSTYGMAEPTHDWVIDTYFTPNGYTGIKLYSSQGAVTQDVADAVNDGCLWVGYYGHSGSSGWWDPSFDQGDVQALTNAGLYGVAWSFSCNVGKFSLGECFGETWLREADKGAAAVIFPSDYIYWGSVEAWEPSTVLEKSFFRAFFVDDVWEVGPAWQAGLYHFLVDFTGSEDIKRNFFELYNLLGDPALLLPQPDGFALAPTPPSQDLCCPPADQAVYTIEVEQLGDFSESITRTADDEPAGATVAFSTNGIAPPFTSVMTVGSLTGAMVGEYTIVVTGTSTSKQRSIGVGLNISNDVPGGVTLLDPPDEATGVELQPELTWGAASGSLSYDLEVATDPAFGDVVYSATVTGTSDTVDTPLGMLTPYYWHVRAVNTCGNSGYSTAFSFTTVNRVMPAYYDMLNGEGGTYTYYDDIYDGDGDRTQPLAPLSNGLGELTDEVIATEHWNQTSGPYVGWVSVDPTITFHFAEPMNIDVVTLHLDDAGGGGGVDVPVDVTVSMGGDTLVFPGYDPPGDEPFAFTCPDLGMSGDTLELTLADYTSSSSYMMLSEVQFYGGPITGACCIDEVCTVVTESECLGATGEYQGDDTGCDPDPCAVFEPDCLILSEIVDGTLSGSCPRYVEITNTGLHNFTFQEGGLIVQTDFSSDVIVDVDLSGITILSGQSYVINATDAGSCSGAFDIVYGFSADLEVDDVVFGDGNDRYILTDTADGSNLLDIYGEFGISGGAWAYGDGYSYRRAAYNSGNDGVFLAGEWFFGGKDSLEGVDPEGLLLAYTTPKVHEYYADCPSTAGDIDDDGDVDLGDYAVFAACMNGPDNPTPPGGCTADDFAAADIENDNDVDLADFSIFQDVFTGS